MFVVRALPRIYNKFHTRAKSQFIGSGICGMPRNRISTKEKLFLTTCMFIFWFPYPLWVLYNIEYYKIPPDEW